MPKHNPAGEVCPLCPAGTPVGFCVRHMAGWDPEKEACPVTFEVTPVAAKPENLDTYVKLKAYADGLPVGQQLDHIRFHIGVCGGQTAEGVRVLGYDEQVVIIDMPMGAAGSRQSGLYWGDIIELWPL